MRSTIAILLCTGVLAFGEAPETAVRAAMDQFAKAVVTKDKATLEKLMGDEILYSHSNAKLDTKASFISDVMNETPKYEAFSYGETTFNFYGNTAIVRGRISVKDVVNGEHRTIELNAMQIWVKGPKGWKMVGRQATRLNP